MLYSNVDSRLVRSQKVNNTAAALFYIYLFTSLFLGAFTCWLRFDKYDWMFMTTTCTWFLSTSISLAASICSLLFWFVIGLPGFIKDSKSVLISYSFLIIVTALLKFIGGFCATSCLYYSVDQAQIMEDSVKLRQSFYGQYGREYYTNGLDDIQRMLRCCSINEIEFFENTPYFLTYFQYPITCCNETIRAPICGRYPNNLFSDTCLKPFLGRHILFLGEVLAFSIAVGIFDLFVAGIILIDQIRNRRSKPKN